jgi:hypothetical protein
LGRRPDTSQFNETVSVSSKDFEGKTARPQSRAVLFIETVA